MRLRVSLSVVPVPACVCARALCVSYCWCGVRVPRLPSEKLLAVLSCPRRRGSSTSSRASAQACCRRQNDRDVLEAQNGDAMQQMRVTPCGRAHIVWVHVWVEGDDAAGQVPYHVSLLQHSSPGNRRHRWAALNDRWQRGTLHSTVVYVPFLRRVFAAAPV